jgi:hypothetical protein
MLPTIRKQPDLVFDDEDTISPTTKKMSNDEMKEFVKDIRKLSNSKTTKGIVQDVERDRKKTKFINCITTTLDNFKKLPFQEDKSQLNKLFIFVMQSCSDTLGNIDDEDNNKLMVDLLKGYVKDDVHLCNQVMECLKKDIKKMTLYRKYKNTFVKTALFFVSLIFRAAK